mgnify:CR=1 FL=1
MFKKFQALISGGKKAYDTITSVPPKVNKTKLDKAKSDLALATQKTKASTAKLGQTMFESKNKAFKGDDFTFSYSKKKTPKVSEQKAKGGRVGLKFGSKRKSNVQKIQETFGPKKQLSAKQMKIAKLAGDPKKIDAKDLAKLRKS